MAQGGNSDAEDSDSSTPTQMDASPHSFPPDQLIRIPKTSSPTYAQIKECISVYESSEVLKPDLKDKRAWQECVRTLFGKMVCFDDLKELGKLRSRISEIRKVNKGNDIVNALYKAVKRIEIEIKRLSPISCFSRNQKNIMNIVSDSFNQENPNYSYPENRDQWEQLARKLKDEWDPEGSKALSTFMAYMYDICNLLNDGPKKEIYKNLANALARIHKAQRKQKNIAPLVDKSSGDDIEIKKLSPISCFSKNQKKILNIVSDSFNQENPNYSYPENRGQWEQLARKLKDEWDPEGSKVLSTFMVCMYGICNLLNDGPKKEICKNLANVLSRIERSQRKQKKIARLVDKASGPNYVDDCVALDKTDLLPIDTSEEQSSLEDDTDDVSTKIIDDLAFVTSAVPSAASSDESSLNMPSSAAYEIRRKILEERRAKVIAIVNAYISSQERPADNKEWEKCARTLFGDLFRFDDEKEITSLRNMLFILFKSNGNIIELRLLGNAVKRIEKPLKRRNRSSSDKLTPAQRESDALPIDTSEELSSMEVAKEGVSTTIVDDRLFLTSAVPSAASADESSPNLPSSDTHKIRSKTYKQKRAEKVIAIVNAYISSQELPTDSQGRQECVRTLFGDLFSF
jgi:hypothetical protein